MLRVGGRAFVAVTRGPGAYLHVTLRSSISSIPDYSGIRIKDRRGGGVIEGQMARTDGGATVGAR